MGERPEARGRLAALLLQRCPRCLRGAVYSGWVRMRESCPACGLRFEREPGYFVGAMYVSYALAVFCYLLLAGLAHLLRPAWSAASVLAAAAVPFVLFSPLLVRSSKILWMHLDWAVHRG